MQTRTPNFKRWFGDLEAAAKITGFAMPEAKATLQNLIRGGGEIETADGAILHFTGQAKKALSKDARTVFRRGSRQENNTTD